MPHIICKLIGHREYHDDVLAVRPWQDKDFLGYSQADFREVNCLRCGDSISSL